VREAVTDVAILPAHVRAPRLRPALGRRLDRLSRAAHRFHRFAHHPLCEQYAGEVIRVGKRARLCRGCSYAALGGVAGVAFAALVRAPLWATLTLIALSVTMGVVSLRWRTSKALSRFVPAAGLAVACAEGLRAETWAGAGVAFGVVLGLAGLVRAYRQRVPDRTPCASCAERELGAACSGIRPIVRRERAFRRVAQRLIDASELTR
jgi:hypothetical protein